jgi:hypothetical protein
MKNEVSAVDFLWKVIRNAFCRHPEARILRPALRGRSPLSRRTPPFACRKGWATCPAKVIPFERAALDAGHLVSDFGEDHSEGFESRAQLAEEH